MPLHRSSSIAALTATAFLTIIWTASTASAADTPPTPPAPTTTTPAPAPDSGDGKGKEKDADKGKEKTKHHEIDATSTQGYHRGYELIYSRGEFAAGIAALKSIGRDDDAAVATLIGYASRKLGRYDDARAWYEKALVSDPANVRTWQYYGMWHLEQGNRLKAEDHLARIALICGGTDCKEYKDLKGALDGTVSY
jgi:tetratricopeptide (TPR) repeat protein